jgi:hypothetical protein
MQEQYIQECKENALRKKALELQLLHNKSVILPILSSTFENYVYFSSSSSSLESTELVMEWIRDVRLGLNPYKHLIHQISSHEGFACLHALNLLRKNKNPNFIYYHAMAEIKNDKDSTFYTLSEDVFEEEDIFSTSFREICETSNWETILEYFISLLLSLYNANKDIAFANYDLNLDNIMMRKCSSEIFDVEYDFENRSLWITNRGYIPTMTRFSKSYINILIDNIPKSFGYNNISQLPFEPKGIYCDRGFVISDAYCLLLNILECTHTKNKEAYENLKDLLLFFTKEDASKLFSSRYFLPLFEKTEIFTIKDYILFIYGKYKDIIKLSPRYDVLRCIGNKLEIKSKSLEYYTVKSTIQLYDLIRYFYDFMDEDNSHIIANMINKSIEYYSKFYEKDNIKKDIERVLEIEDCLKSHNVIFEIPEFDNILKNTSYSKILKKYIDSCIVYFNGWERLKTGIKILNYLSSSSEIFKELYDKYVEIMENNKDYYNNMYINLINIRKYFRSNLSLFKIYKTQILFLESLE